jgi:sugar phosphate isomerase/epimerase
MLGRDDLVLCAGTLLASSLPERAKAAQAAGYAGMSLWLADVMQARRDGMTDADIRALFVDHGLEVAELDCLANWLPGTTAPPDLPFDVDDVMLATDHDFYAIAESIGGRSINAAEIFGSPTELDAAVEAFVGVCDRAAEHGLLVHLEFLPWSAFPNLSSAWEVVRLADRPNGGVLVDTWHCARSDTTLADLMAIPGDRVLGVQLSDATAEPAYETITEETMRARLLPGEGVGHVIEFVRTLDRIGCQAPIGVEVFSDELAAMDPSEAARRVADATRRLLAEAAQ